MKQILKYLAASLASLAIAACGNGAQSSEANEGRAGEPGTAEVSTSIEQAVVPSGAPSSKAGPSKPSSVIRAPSWMPKGWDETGFLSASFQNIPEGERMAARVQEAEASMPFLFYMFANDSGLDESNEPVWVLWQAFRSCERAEQLINDLTAEFGDRARGKASIAAARQDFLNWAATQPKEVTFYTWANLGAWDQATSTFSIDKYGYVSVIDLEQAKAAFPEMIDATAAFMDTYGSLSLRPNLIPFWCPSQDGETLLSFDTQYQTWRMQLGAYDPTKSLPGVPGFSGFPGWPELKMDRDAAVAFSNANPERRVRIAFKVILDQTPIPNSGGNVMNLVAQLRSATITDPSGKVLAAKDY